MYYYRVTVAYKGTHYFGWQAQSTDTLYEEMPTVEGTILNALKKITNYQSCTISAASRTDGGVHAQGQRAKITILNEISPEHLLLGLNSLLPDDIRILNCVSSTKGYQPTAVVLARNTIITLQHRRLIMSPPPILFCICRSITLRQTIWHYYGSPVSYSLANMIFITLVDEIKV